MAVPFPFEPVAGGGVIYEQTHVFRDAKGLTATVRYFISANGATADNTVVAVQAILAQIKSRSNAAYQGSSGVLSEYGVKQYGTAAAYASVRQKARLTFQDSAGGLHALNIPAAKLAEFDTDEQTVLPSAVAGLTALFANAAVVIGSAVPFVATRTALPITNYMGGFFVARQTKRNKLFILNASLTPSEPGD